MLASILDDHEIVVKARPASVIEGTPTSDSLAIQLMTCPEL